MQPERKNHACCHRCKHSFKAGDLRLQGVRTNELSTGQRNTSRYFRTYCVDAILPEARRITGFGGLDDTDKQEL